MDQVLRGVRVVEVAQWWFVPAAGAVLADWGADVLKVEHPVSGDPQRGLMTSGLVPNTGGVNFMVEQPNRGKRSVGIDLEQARGSGGAAPAARDRRRLPHQLPARSPPALEDRVGGHPRGERQDHLRARSRPGRPRTGLGERRLRRRLVLVPRRHLQCTHPVRRPGAGDAARRLRRFNRRAGARRRHRRRPLPPRAQRRAIPGRPVAARHRHVDHGPRHHRHQAAERRDAAVQPRRRAQSDRQQLQDQGRPLAVPEHAAARPLLARPLPAHRPSGADRRRALQGRDVALHEPRRVRPGSRLRRSRSGRSRSGAPRSPMPRGCGRRCRVPSSCTTIRRP